VDAVGRIWGHVAASEDLFKIFLMILVLFAGQI
jgi:hypothetical protein